MELSNAIEKNLSNEKFSEVKPNNLESERPQFKELPKIDGLKEKQIDNLGEDRESTRETKELPHVETRESPQKEVKEHDVEKEDIEKVKKDYIDDVKANSDCPETIDKQKFMGSELEKTSPEKVAEKREEFAEKKKEMISQWEEANDREWPKYKDDVYITNKDGEKVKIRNAGDKYDAHHIQPLSMGGKNEASNITPLRADVHTDHRGVHRLDGPYGKLEKAIGEK